MPEPTRSVTASDLRVLPARKASKYVGVAKVKPTDPPTFGAWLKERMTRVGISAVDLAAATSDHPLGPVNPSTISNLRNDNARPGFEVLTKLHGPLGVSLGEALVASGLTTFEDLGVTAPAMPPVVRDIMTRLGPKSPLPERGKAILELHLLELVQTFDKVYANVLAELISTEGRR